MARVNLDVWLGLVLLLLLLLAATAKLLLRSPLGRYRWPRLCSSRPIKGDFPPRLPATV